MTKIMKAKFKSRCMETGQDIRKGETILWIKGHGVYAAGSKRFQEENQRPDPAGNMLDDGIEQAAERWYGQNY